MSNHPIDQSDGLVATYDKGWSGHWWWISVFVRLEREDEG
jgi:hypothetical protein